MEFRGQQRQTGKGIVWSFVRLQDQCFPDGFVAFDCDPKWHTIRTRSDPVWITGDLAALVAIDYLLERGWTMRKDACDKEFLALYQSTQCESVT